MDYEQLAKEFLRALRGKRSQVAWSRRLGYRSNVAYTWEKGRRWPTAAEAMRAADRNGVDLSQAFLQFFGSAPPDWLGKYNLTTSKAVAALLDEMRGNTTIVELSKRTGASRYAISRWLTGQTEPRLPDFFRLFEASSTRLLDLVCVLVDPADVPAVSEQIHLQEMRRNGAYRLPWTQAIIRTLELESYLALPAHRPGWIAHQIGIDMQQEAACFAFLQETDQVEWNGTHYVARTVAVDTRGRPEIGRRLKAHWTEEGARRIKAGAPGQFSYVVFSVSEEDFERIRELHLRYFNTLRGIISESTPSEMVAVANVQLFGLGEMVDV